MPAKPHKGTRMKPNSIALLTLGVSLLALSANGQDRLTREEYIQKYKSLAVEEMEAYPASPPASRWPRRCSNRTTATGAWRAKATTTSASNAKAPGPVPRSRTTTMRKANVSANTRPSRPRSTTIRNSSTNRPVTRTCSNWTRWITKGGLTDSNRLAMRPIRLMPNCSSKLSKTTSSTTSTGAKRSPRRSWVRLRPKNRSNW